MSTARRTHDAMSKLSHAQTGEHWIEALAHHRHALIRPLAPEDREREFQFIRHLSPETKRGRFLGTLSDPSPNLMEQMMEVDHAQREAYVALAYVDGELREVGIARYAGQFPDPSCECAVTVADAWQRCGLGHQLMVHLMEAARRNGFTRMVSVDLANNVPADRLFRRLGFSRKFAEGSYQEVVHEIQL